MIKNPGTTKARRRRGLSLLEVSAALGILVLVIGGLAQLVAQTGESVRARGAAERLREITKASQQYIDAYAPQLLQHPTIMADQPLVIPIGRTNGASLPPNGPTATLPSVQGAGMLYRDFIDNNPYGHSHALVVRKIDPVLPNQKARIEGMIVSQGGAAIPDRSIGTVATLAGAQGGFIMQVPVAGFTTNDIVGTRGGWRAQASNWTAGSVSPQPGHVMSVVGVNDSTLNSPYLARIDVGDPEQNTMRVALAMGGNAITNAPALCAGGATAAGCVGTTGTVELGPNIHVNGEVAAGGNITAVGTGNFGNGVYAPIYYDRTNNTYYMQPAGLTNLNTLRTQSFSLDTRVSGTYNKSAVFGGNGTNNQYRLGDLLPRYVLQEGYAASSGAPNVYKPLCGAGGEAKIILHPRADSWAFQANLNITVTDDGVSTSPATTIVRRQYMASDLGTYWRVNLTGTDHAEAWEAMAMTYCYYP